MRILCDMVVERVGHVGTRRGAEAIPIQVR
jgi:hypothetical protein